MRTLKLLFFIFSVSLFGCSNTQQSIPLSNAYNELRLGNRDKAYVMLLRLEGKLKGDELGYCYLYLASITREAGMLKRALKYNEKAFDNLTDRRGIAAAMKNTARILGEMGDLEEAQLFYYDAIKRYNDDSLKGSAMNSYGVVLLENGKHDAARDVFERALTYRHLKGRIYNNIGHNELKAGNIDTAIYYLTQSIQMTGHNVSIALGNLSAAYLLKGNDSLSYKYARAALATGNNDVDLLDALENNPMMIDSLLMVSQLKVMHYEKQEAIQKEYERKALYYMIQAHEMENRNKKIILWGTIGITILVLAAFWFINKYYKSYKIEQHIRKEAKKIFTSS